MFFSKSKKNNLEEDYKNYLKSLNLDAPNDYVEKIDKKLDKIFKSMDYEDYIQFIKSNTYLKTYDDIMGNYANNVPLSKNMVKIITSDFYNKVDEIIQKKIDELDL